MGQCHFTNFCLGRASPKYGGRSSRVMGRTHGSIRLEVWCGTVKKLMLGDREHLLFIERRQDILHALGNHAFAAAGIALHEKIVHACCCNQCGTLRHSLPFDMHKVTLVCFDIIVRYACYLNHLRVISKCLHRSGKLLFTHHCNHFTQCLYCNKVHS